MSAAQTLGPLLERGAPLSARQALAVVAEVARQITDLHAQGQLHLAIGRQSVKVENNTVLLTPSSVSQTLGTRATSVGLPPEYEGPLPIELPVDIPTATAALARAGYPFDPRRIDIYQLGALLGELATGRPIADYLQSPIVKAKVPRSLAQIIDRALGFEPAQRFGEATQLAALVNRVLEHAARSADKAPTGDTSPRPGGNQ